MHMSRERISMAGNRSSAFDNLQQSDVRPVNQTFCGHQVYKKNDCGTNAQILPAAYAYIVCREPRTDLQHMLGKEAVICMPDGSLIVREIRQGSKVGHYDLYGPCIGTIRNANPRWVAQTMCSFVEEYWDVAIAAGQVQPIQENLH